MTPPSEKHLSSTLLPFCPSGEASESSSYSIIRAILLPDVVRAESCPSEKEENRRYARYASLHHGASFRDEDGYAVWTLYEELNKTQDQGVQLGGRQTDTVQPGSDMTGLSLCRYARLDGAPDTRDCIGYLMIFWGTDKPGWMYVTC